MIQEHHALLLLRRFSLFGIERRTQRRNVDGRWQAHLHWIVVHGRGGYEQHSHEVGRFVDTRILPSPTIESVQLDMLPLPVCDILLPQLGALRSVQRLYPRLSPQHEPVCSVAIFSWVGKGAMYVPKLVVDRYGMEGTVLVYARGCCD